MMDIGARTSSSVHCYGQFLQLEMPECCEAALTHFALLLPLQILYADV